MSLAIKSKPDLIGQYVDLLRFYPNWSGQPFATPSRVFYSLPPFPRFVNPFLQLSPLSLLPFLDKRVRI